MFKNKMQACIVKKYSYTNGMELTKEILKNRLKEESLKVTFKKLDGTERVMNCTLQESFLPKLEKQDETKRVKKDSETNLSVGDIDKNSWRSFRIENIIKIENYEPTTNCISS
jgi:hypothetical protein